MTKSKVEDQPAMVEDQAPATLAGDVETFLSLANGTELMWARGAVLRETADIPSEARRDIAALLAFEADIAPEVARGLLERALEAISRWPILHRRALESIGDRWPFLDARLSGGKMPANGFLTSRPYSTATTLGTDHGQHEVLNGRVKCATCFLISGAAYGYQPSDAIAEFRAAVGAAVGDGEDKTHAIARLASELSTDERAALLSKAL